MQVGELHDLLRVHSSRPTSNLASRLEQYHGWDTRDSELRCCQRGYLRIQFRENDLGRKEYCCLCKCWGHHATWTAPRCPKIDEDWHLRSRDELRKRFVRQVDRMYREQLLFALAANGFVGQFRIKHPIHGEALGAD